MKGEKLSKRCETPKATYHIFPLTWHSRKGKTVELEIDQRFPGVRVGTGWDGLPRGSKGNLGVLLEFCIVTVMVSTCLFAFVRTDRTMYHKSELYCR